MLRIALLQAGIGLANHERSLAMDPSNRLAIALGEQVVEASELSPADWVAVVERVLAKCKPHLKYFPDFVPLSDGFNHHLQHYDRCITDESLVTYTRGLDRTTRCTDLAFLSHDVEGRHPLIGGVRFVQMKMLLLAQNGSLVLSDRKHERRMEEGHGFHRTRTAVNEVTVFWNFTVLDEALGAVLTPKVMKALLDRLRELADKNVSERKQRLESSRDVAYFLKEFPKHIKF